MAYTFVKELHKKEKIFKKYEKLISWKEFEKLCEIVRLNKLDEADNKDVKRYVQLVKHEEKMNKLKLVAGFAFGLAIGAGVIAALFML